MSKYRQIQTEFPEQVPNAFYSYRQVHPYCTSVFFLFCCHFSLEEFAWFRRLHRMVELYMDQLRNVMLIWSCHCLGIALYMGILCWIPTHISIASYKDLAVCIYRSMNRLSLLLTPTLDGTEELKLRSYWTLSQNRQGVACMYRYTTAWAHICLGALACCWNYVQTNFINVTVRMCQCNNT